MNVYYMLLTTNSTNFNFKIKLLQQNIFKFLKNLDYDHTVLTQKHIYPLIDKSLLGCHNLLSGRILHDLYFLTVIQNNNGFYLDHNITFKKFLMFLNLIFYCFLKMIFQQIKIYLKFLPGPEKNTRSGIIVYHYLLKD